MSRTPFKMPPRPQRPAIKLDEWVAGGEAAETAEEGTTLSERPAGKIARLTIDLPAELHARFKAGCALKGTRMVDEVRRLIEEWTQKNG